MAGLLFAGAWRVAVLMVLFAVLIIACKIAKI